MVPLGTFPLPEADGHHLVDTALEGTFEVRVPFHPAAQHDAVALEGPAVHRHGDSFRSRANMHDLQRAFHGHSHGGLVDAVVRQHIRLPLRCGSPMAAHDRDDKRIHPP